MVRKISIYFICVTLSCMTVGCSTMSPERERDCLIGAGVGALVAGGAITGALAGGHAYSGSYQLGVRLPFSRAWSCAGRELWSPPCFACSMDCFSDAGHSSFTTLAALTKASRRGSKAKPCASWPTTTDRSYDCGQTDRQFIRSP